MSTKFNYLEKKQSKALRVFEKARLQLCKVASQITGEIAKSDEAIAEMNEKISQENENKVFLNKMASSIDNRLKKFDDFLKD